MFPERADSIWFSGMLFRPNDLYLPINLRSEFCIIRILSSARLSRIIGRIDYSLVERFTWVIARSSRLIIGNVYSGNLSLHSRTTMGIILNEYPLIRRVITPMDSTVQVEWLYNCASIIDIRKSDKLSGSVFEQKEKSVVNINANGFTERRVKTWKC